MERKRSLVGAGIAIGVAAAGLPLTAQAFPYTYYYSPSYTYAGSYTHTGDTSYAESGLVTRTDTLRANTQVLTGIIGDRIAAAMFNRGPGPRRTALNDGSANKLAMNGEGQTGIATGDAASRLSAWGTLSWTDMNNTNASTKYDGSLYNLATGLDYAVNDNLVVGLSLSYERTKLDTRFNAGDQDTHGYSVVPYAAYRLTPNTVLDGMIGFSQLGTETHRSANGAPNIEGDYNGKRFLFATNLSHTVDIGDLSLRGRVGFNHAHEVADGFTEKGGATWEGQSTNLSEGKIGLRGGYALGKFEPYAGVDYLYDFVMDHQVSAASQKSPSNDKDEVLGTIGVNYFITDNAEAGLEVTHGFAREDIRNTGVMLNGRIGF